jgi:hypothetical protein
MEQMLEPMKSIQGEMSTHGAKMNARQNPSKQEGKSFETG